MRPPRARSSDCPGNRGFSIVELLVVMGIIGIMVAVSIPAIARFIRNYRITGAAEQVATEIQRARTNAIMRNVNLGTIFVVLRNAKNEPTDYDWAYEDDLNPTSGTNWTNVRQPWSVLFDPTMDPPQASTLRSLPFGVEFNTKCYNETGSPPDDTTVPPTQTPNAIGFRFNRIGAWCAFGTTECPAVTGAPTNNYVFSDANGTGSTICLVDRTTGLTRFVSVTSGGRVLGQK